MKTDIMGIPFDNVTMDEAIQRATELLETEKFYCVTPNSEIVYDAMHNSELMELLRGAALILPDGAGVVLASKILKRPLKQKVAGVDFSDRLLEVLAARGLRLYLFGSSAGTAEAAAAVMQKRHPGLYICGTACGYFNDEAAEVAKINAAHADVVFVCLGSPKQELFIRDHIHELDVKMMIGLGGTLNAFSGKTKRAPQWMIRLNLEWLYRLIKEPRRIGRMMRLPKFILTVIFRGRKG